MYPEQYQQLIQDEPEILCRGGSVIVSPLGKIMEGPLVNTSGALVAELDLDEIVQGKFDFDVSGHYSRNDIFTFKVKDQPETGQEKSL
jgi:nitrilase